MTEPSPWTWMWFAPGDLQGSISDVFLQAEEADAEEARMAAQRGRLGFAAPESCSCDCEGCQR